MQGEGRKGMLRDGSPGSRQALKNTMRLVLRRAGLPHVIRDKAFDIVHSLDELDMLALPFPR